MRIDRLDLIRFGHFRDISIDLPPTPLTLILGANESGKSTALAAIADALFGIDERSPYAFHHGYDGMRVGAAVSLPGGETLEFIRRKGRKNLLTGPDGAPVPDDALAPFVGGVTRATFEEVFGLNQARLREGGAALIAGGGALSESLVAAAPGLSRILDLRHQLIEEAGRLYAPRASKLPWNEALKRHEDGRRRLREEMLSAEQVAERVQAAEAAREAVAGLDRDRRQTTEERARLMRLRTAAPVLAKLDALRAQQSAFDHLPALDRDYPDRVREALTAEQEATASAKTAAERLRQAAERRDQISVDRALLAHGDAIDTLQGQVQVVAKHLADLPARQSEQRAEAQRLDALARRIGLAKGQALAPRQPSDADLAKADGLLQRAAERSAAEARDREERRASAARLAESKREAADLMPPQDLAGLRDRLASLVALGDLMRDAATAAEEAKKAQAGLDKLLDEVARAAGVREDATTLLAKPWPSEAALEAAARRLQEARDALARAAAEQDAIAADLRVTEAALTALAEDPATPDPDHLAEMRAERDALWPALAQALGGDAPPPGSDAAHTFRVALDRADQAADHQIAAASRLAEIQQLRRQRAEDEAKQVAAGGSLHRTHAARDAAETAWRGLWAQAAPALAEAPVGDGRRGREIPALLARLAEAQDRAVSTKANAQARRQRQDDAITSLDALAADLGLEAEDLSPPDRLSACRRRLQDAEAIAARRREVEVAIRSAEAEIERLDARAAAREADGDADAESWQAVTAALIAPPNAGCEELTACRAAWGEAPAALQAHATVTHRIDRMREDIARFEEDVDTLLAQVSPADAGRKPPIDGQDRLAAIAQLSRGLRDARAAEAAEKQASESLAAAETDALDSANRARDAVRATEALRALAGLDPEAPLAPFAAQLDQRHRLEDRLTEEAGRLTEIAPTLQETDLRAALSSQSIDELDAAIEDIGLREERLNSDIQTAVQRRTEADATLSALQNATGAAGAAQDVAEAASDLAAIAEAWVLKRLAADWLGEAADAWRVRHQNPMLTRAGAAFATITDHRFTGLKPDFTDTDSPALVAERSDGEAIDLAGLSEGTADQLFLALRVAAIEAFAARARPLPFIADDLFVTFDEARTAGGLRVLAEMGTETQVLVFTHHRHVAEIARETVPGAHVIELAQPGAQAP